MKIGVLGGTFDPVHVGHLKAADAVTAHLKLEEVIFMPAGNPWLKAGYKVTPAAHRVAMLRLALAGKSIYKLSTLEVDRPGPTYTADTMTALRAEHPEAELFFILGWDNLSQLPRWHEPAQLIGLCNLVAVRRVDFPEPDLEALERVLPGLKQRVILLHEPRIDVNATMIRARLAKGEPIKGMVAPAVECYIVEHGLYR